MRFILTVCSERDQPKSPEPRNLVCGVGIIDTRSGRTIATFMLRSGVEEIDDVQVVSVRSLALSGPNPDVDGSAVSGDRAPQRCMGEIEFVVCDATRG
jgi:hypothetical protein